MARIEISKHLAADTRICDGRLIFKGSRILISDALELAKEGYTPEAIARQYQDLISPEAVRDAIISIKLSKQRFLHVILVSFTPRCVIQTIAS